jgi:hypothetical protein
VARIQNLEGEGKSMRAMTRGFLTFILWATFVLSTLSTFLTPITTSLQEAAEYRTEVTGYGTARNRERVGNRRLAREFLPSGISRVLMVLSAGFLLVVAEQRSSSAQLLAAVGGLPAGMAEALRSAVTKAKDKVQA